MTPEPRLSVIVPAFNGARVLSESLPALEASDLPREMWELIVVDDASTDDTAVVAQRHADTVVRLEGAAHGPAYARNRGSEAARGGILVFIDADVCVQPATLRQFLDVFAAEPDVAAVFGAYDTTPRAAGLVSQYRNLLHHYVHASQAGDADTFWAGCGAIRRSAFVRAGRFDAQRYARPQIEDIELGYRLRSQGRRILLRPEIQGTHLKHWTLRGMIRNDVRDRGIPWLRLLLEREAVGGGTLNVRAEERWLTAVTALALLALAAAPLTRSWIPAGFAVACVLLILARNAALFRWFAQVRDRGFALRIVPLRLLYYVLNAITVGIVAVQYPVSRFAGRRAVAAVSGTGPGPASPATTDRPVRGRAP